MPAGQSEPSLLRLMTAFTLAVAGPLLVVALLASQGTGLLNGLGFAAIGSFYAAIPALLFGVPAYLLLRRRVKPNAWLCIGVGALLASMPWAAFALFSPELGMAAILGAPCGALGGLIFWLIASRGLAERTD